MLGQRPDIGIAVGLVVGAAACLANAGSPRLNARRQDPVTSNRRRRHAGEFADDIGPRGLIHELGDASGLVLGGPFAQLRGRPGEGELRQQIGRQCNRLLVDRREPHQVAFVGDEVTLGRRNGVDRRHPFGAAR